MEDPDHVGAMISKVVDEIWDQYDDDNSGELDRAEAKGFLDKTLRDLDKNYYLSKPEFSKFFEEFDADGGGTISKPEMAGFLKKVLEQGKANKEGFKDEKKEEPERFESVEAARFASFFEGKCLWSYGDTLYLFSSLKGPGQEKVNIKIKECSD